jgi:hypothetical protein
VPGSGPELARTWAKVIPAALNAKPREGPPARAEVIHDPERSHLKIVLVGSPEITAGLLNLVQVWLDQLKP